MLCHNFTLRVSTGVYGSRILSSLYICNSYNMGKRDLPDIYAQAQGCGHIYQENPECPCYNHFRHSKDLPKTDVNNSASLYSNGYSL